jgi:hypothetical protein
VFAAGEAAAVVGVPSREVALELLAYGFPLRAA